MAKIRWAIIHFSDETVSLRIKERDGTFLSITMDRNKTIRGKRRNRFYHFWTRFFRLERKTRGIPWGAEKMPGKKYAPLSTGCVTWSRFIESERNQSSRRCSNSYGPSARFNHDDSPNVRTLYYETFHNRNHPLRTYLAQKIDRMTQILTMQSVA